MKQLSGIGFVLAALIFFTAGTALQAGQLNGSITFSGGVQLDAGTVATATKVTGWLDQNGINPAVVSSSGDFVGLNGSIATFVAPWNFNSGPIPAFWQVGGFTFDVTASSIASQDSTFVNVTAPGFISGNGFDPTPATFFFTAQSPPAGVVFSFSAANPAMPCTGKIGDFVWNDLNKDGCQDVNEPGIGGVTVELWRGCPAGTKIRTTNTTANGFYLFTDLCAGDYTVKFTTPAGYTRTVFNPACAVGGRPPNETDSDCSKDCPNPGPDCGICVNLPANNSENLTIDCGYVPTLALMCAGGSGQVGVPYNSALVASGGVPPYTYSVVVGSLPPGLTLNPVTGAITGIPTAAGTYPYAAMVVDSSGNAAGTLIVDCNITIIGVGGCRVTGGANKQENTYQSLAVTELAGGEPAFVSHGGQVGAPHSVGSPWSPNSPCIDGSWQHNRHKSTGNGKNSLVGTFHATGSGKTHEFDSLLCACLPCAEAGSIGIVGGLCNPGNRICGPEPRKAPANKICFSGVGDYTFTNGKKTVRAVFRVDIEDRSEGNSPASSLPPDRYRIRFWFLNKEVRGTDVPEGSTLGLALRWGASADAAQIGILASTENLKNNASNPYIPGFNMPPADIDDGGDLSQGNHQIHPQTGSVCTP